MREIVLDSYGKINLALDVINKRKDGYHNIETVMQEISLRDTLTIRCSKDNNIVIKSDDKNIPLDKENLVYQAWELMKEESKIDKGVSVLIEKRIPVAAGLAGGSANAASMLKGINELWNLNYSISKLEKIGKKIGADVPFCLRGGTLLAKGIGDEFKSLKSFKDRQLLLINPKIPMDTKKVYESLSLGNKDDFQIDKIIEKINLDDTVGVSKNLYNRLEKIVIGEVDIVAKLKNDLIQNKALGSLMSGSGTTVFGIFDNKEDRDYAYDKLIEKYPNYIIIKTETK